MQIIQQISIGNIKENCLLLPVICFIQVHRLLGFPCWNHTREPRSKVLHAQSQFHIYILKDLSSFWFQQTSVDQSWIISSMYTEFLLAQPPNVTSWYHGWDPRVHHEHKQILKKMFVSYCSFSALECLPRAVLGLQQRGKWAEINAWNSAIACESTLWSNPFISVKSRSYIEKFGARWRGFQCQLSHETHQTLDLSHCLTLIYCLAGFLQG